MMENKCIFSIQQMEQLLLRTPLRDQSNWKKVESVINAATQKILNQIFVSRKQLKS